MVRKGKSLAVAALGLLLCAVSPSHASTTQVKKAGSLTATSDAALMIFCPDPLIQQTLNQDFRAAKRNATADATKVLSLTVTVSQQPLKPGVFERAAAAAAGCDLLLAIGSTLTVEPAASLCGIAAGAGASLVIVNRDPTPYDPVATDVIRDPIGQAVPRLADQLLAARQA